jgi:FMN phosphatase YigB (HAD superfamily)
MYHDILKAVLDDAGATFADLIVVGDIFELDLAMPLALGARVGLVVSSHTPAYERAFVGEHPRGRLIEHLSEIPSLLA